MLVMMDRLQTSKQRILESNLTVGEKTRIFQKLIEFEEGCALIIETKPTIEIIFQEKKK